MLRLPKRLTVRSQLLALMLAVGLPAAGGVGWALSMVLASEKDAATARVRSTSVQVANNLALLMREREALLARLAGLAARQPAGTDPCATLAVEWARLPVDHAALTLHGPDGQRLCGGGAPAPAAPGPPLGPWFRQGLLADGPSAGPVLQVPATGRWMAPLSQPLHDASGQLVGLLVLPLDLLALQQRVMPPPTSPALVSVIDGNDALLMRSVDAQQWLGQPPPTGLAVRARGLRDGVLVGEGLDGRRRLFAFAGVAGTP